MKFILFLILITSAQSTFGAILIEPYLGRNLILSTDTGSYFGYGGRAALSLKNAYLGIDYGLGSFSDKTTSNSIKYTDDFSRKRLSLFFGYSFGNTTSKSRTGKFSKILPYGDNKKRIWISYIADVRDDVTSTGGYYNSNQSLTGKGFEVGFSRPLFYFFSGRLSLRKLAFDKIEDAAGTSTALSGGNIQNVYEFEIGLGIPLALF